MYNPYKNRVLFSYEMCACACWEAYCISGSCMISTFALAASKQEELPNSGVNGCEGLTVRSLVSLWDPFS